PRCPREAEGKVIEPPPPPINPLFYPLFGVSILSLLWVIFSSVGRGRSEREQFAFLLAHIHAVKVAVETQGRAVPHLLVRQERRRLKARARDAQLRLSANDRADVNQVIEAEAGGDR